MRGEGKPVHTRHSFMILLLHVSTWLYHGGHVYTNVPPPSESVYSSHNVSS